MRRPFKWLLPVAWIVISGISFAYPGDEYNLWGFSSIAGTWILFFAASLFAGQHPRDFLPAVLVAGFVTMAMLGWLLDRLRAPRMAFVVTWLVLAIAGLINALVSYPSYARALAKNGSLAAYIFSSLNFALTSTTLLFLAAAAVLAILRRVRGGGDTT